MLVGLFNFDLLLSPPTVEQQHEAFSNKKKSTARKGMRKFDGRMSQGIGNRNEKGGSLLLCENPQR